MEERRWKDSSWGEVKNPMFTFSSCSLQDWDDFSRCYYKYHGENHSLDTWWDWLFASKIEPKDSKDYWDIHLSAFAAGAAPSSEVPCRANGSMADLLHPFLFTSCFDMRLMRDEKEHNGNERERERERAERHGSADSLLSREDSTFLILKRERKSLELQKTVPWVCLLTQIRQCIKIYSS